MDYKKIYKELIEKRRKFPIFKKDYICEKHHILPRCRGGSNKKSNLINLTPREHYIAHLLLWKIYENTKSEIKMLYAITIMATNIFNNPEKLFHSKTYELARKRQSKVLKEYFKSNGHPCEGRFKYPQEKLESMYSCYIENGFEYMKEKFSYEFSETVFVKNVTRRGLRKQRDYRGAKHAFESDSHNLIVNIKDDLIKYGFDFIFEKYSWLTTMKRRDCYDIANRIIRHGFNIYDIRTRKLWSENHNNKNIIELLNMK